MPFKSRKQYGMFWILYKQGKITKKKIKEWIAKTPRKIKNLPLYYKKGKK